MPHFRPTYVGAIAAICSSISLGMLGGPPLKPDATLPHGPVNVGFLEASAGGEKNASVETSGSGEISGSRAKGKTTEDDNGKSTDHDHGMNNNYGRGEESNSFAATAHGSGLPATTAASTNWKPLLQHGAGRSNSPKPKIPTTVGRNDHGVPDPEAAALLMSALFGLGMERYCAQRAACRVPVRPSGR